jgi:hypothetical protein
MSDGEIKSAEISLTADEVAIIINALNEVCNDMEVDEFNARIGADRPKVMRLLEQISESIG